MAAALGFNFANSHVTASLPDNWTIKAGGVLTLSASNDTDAQAKGDGGSVDPTNGSAGSNKFQIGVGVAINVVNVTNTADVGQNDNITAKGLTLEALTTNSSSTADTQAQGSPDGTSSFGAQACPGRATAARSAWRALWR